MTKPHEETWTWDDEAKQIVATTPNTDPDEDPSRVVVETDSGVYPPRAGERELIAAAPDMARLLLAIEWVDPGPGGVELFCPSCDEGRSSGHARKCALDAALRKAGVR